MKKANRLTLSLLTVSLFVFTASTSLAHGQDRGEAKAKVGNANVSVEYGRPELRGRDPMKLMQPGSLWRIGANAATTITSDADLDFGGTRVAKGKHFLLARLAEAGKWSLIVSSKAANEYEPGSKIAEVPLELKDGEESVELMSINLSNQDGRGVIEIVWGTSRLTGSFAAAK
ncbi:MAG: DUF2911 domain-containing protein [Acidobacteria bacterium]|nr:DUF2911 domain-containing protein [Acidobacteriota bacterium]MBI1983441.1 DUF2911 domain-containing protein [Acidobacteriota bacterium]